MSYILFNSGNYITYFIYYVIFVLILNYIICKTEIVLGKKYDDDIIRSADAMKIGKKARYIDYNCDKLLKNMIYLLLLIFTLNIAWINAFESFLFLEPIYILLNIVVPSIMSYAIYMGEYYKWRILLLNLVTMITPIIPLLVYTANNYLLDNNNSVIIIIILQTIHTLQTVYLEDSNISLILVSLIHLIYYLIYYTNSNDINILISSIILLTILLIIDKNKNKKVKKYILWLIKILLSIILYINK